MLSTLVMLFIRLVASLITLAFTLLPGGAPSVQVSLPTPPTGVSVSDVTSRSDTSANWAGYAATGGTFTAVSGTWTVPQVGSGGQIGADATWIGIGGIDSRDLIQSGTRTLVNSSGQVDYSAFVETLPQAAQDIPVTVNGGDSVTVSIVQQSTGDWLMTFKDNTTGQSYQTRTSYDSSLSSAEWIEEAPSAGRRELPLDSFGAVSLSNAFTTENGKQVAAAAAGAKPITMTNYGDQVLASPSALGRDGASFTVTRSDASSYPAGSQFGTGSGRRYHFGVGPSYPQSPYGQGSQP